jgi:hypothetical protein
LAGPLTIDFDSSIVAVFGRGKQGAAFGYTKVRGYHPLLATCAQTGQVVHCRLRGGAAGAARGAKSFLTETVSRVRDAGASGQLAIRADSAFYSKTVLGTARKLGVRFSVTIRQDSKVRAAIAAIDEAAWAPIPYWLSTPEVSGADVAETGYTAPTTGPGEASSPAPHACPESESASQPAAQKQEIIAAQDQSWIRASIRSGNPLGHSVRSLL